MARLRSFLALPRRRQSRLLRAVALLLVLGPALRLLGVRRTHDLLAAAPLREHAAVEGGGADSDPEPVDDTAGGTGPSGVPADVHAVCEAVRTADRHLPGSRSCLERSLAATRLLERAGHAPVHRIGVAPEDGALAAHSWVEHDGAVVLGAVEDLERFAPVGEDGAVRSAGDDEPDSDEPDGDEDGAPHGTGEQLGDDHDPSREDGS